MANFNKIPVGISELPANLSRAVAGAWFPAVLVAFKDSKQFFLPNDISIPSVRVDSSS